MRRYCLLATVALLLLPWGCSDDVPAGDLDADLDVVDDTSGDAAVDPNDDTTADVESDIESDAVDLAEDAFDAGDALVDPDTIDDDASIDPDLMLDPDVVTDPDLGNTPPVAIVEHEVLSLVGQLTFLSGSGSDADGDTYTLQWTQASGSTAILSDATTDSPSFFPRQAGVYTFSLVVNDGLDDSAPATTTVRVHDIDGGPEHSLALRPDGTVWAWGINNRGQLGDWTYETRLWPGRVCDSDASDCDADPLTNIVAIATGREHSLALASNGTVWAWGGNNDSELGTVTDTTCYSGSTCAETPVPVCASNDGGCTPLDNVVAFAAGRRFSTALTTDGSVWTWGDNNYSQLGDGTNDVGANPGRVCAFGEDAPCDTFLNNIEAIAAGNFHALALTTDGDLLAWGDNDHGQLGNDDIFDSTVPVLVAGYPSDAVPPQTAVGPCTAQSNLERIQSCSVSNGRVRCTTEPGCLNLRDQLYDGTMASMRCVRLNSSTYESNVTGFQATLWLEHSGAGDLVVKLTHPDGTVVTLLSRPGLAETADDGSETGGSTAPMSWDWPITFAHGAAVDAETIGPASDTICDSTSPCEVAPNAGAALPAGSLDVLDEKVNYGDWMLCIGDASDNGVGGISGFEVSWPD